MLTLLRDICETEVECLENLVVLEALLEDPAPCHTQLVARDDDVLEGLVMAEHFSQAGGHVLAQAVAGEVYVEQSGGLHEGLAHVPAPLVPDTVQLEVEGAECDVLLEGEGDGGGTLCSDVVITQVHLF